MSMPQPSSEAGPHLRHVLTSAAAALGVDGFDNQLGVPESSICVVVLADGLGDQLLAAHSGHARFLGGAWRRQNTAQVLDTGAPTTTASSLASFGTGLSPGRHGLVGYDVFAPELGRVVNMLGQWDAEVDPAMWQPYPTVFEQAAAFGAQVLTSSRPKFRQSALTQAALHGGEFVGAETIEQRFVLAEEWIRRHRSARGGIRNGPPDPLMIYLYVDELDKAGHRAGAGSDAWLRMLETLDSAVSRFSAQLRRDFGDQATVVLTADHGMVNIAEDRRIDITGRADLLEGISHTGGEPRFLHLYAADPGQAERIAAQWAHVYGDLAWVVTRQQAVDAGWFGAVDQRVLPRIGDVMIAIHGDLALFHTERTGEAPLKMIGQHGSLTEAERRVPLLELTGRSLTA
ncbi:alkaline phosphatase family protein [Nesterenkonia salmonea]|uniref:Alkaline phosphatase family protein n=1 Tax=Nesterenkonia salmonea TaxID=1804987 RepID=A0A5R9BBF0_9MICC|nr:nucleotide pyrophosphatase/phosphodiesterase family protein [Nesterenkonia salmonea]TLP97966.1 alkaline phosphatase family protein [Nesterenkonia salmonea]